MLPGLQRKLKVPPILSPGVERGEKAVRGGASSSVLEASGQRLAHQLPGQCLAVVPPCHRSCECGQRGKELWMPEASRGCLSPPGTRWGVAAKVCGNREPACANPRVLLLPGDSGLDWEGGREGKREEKE